VRQYEQRALDALRRVLDFLITHALVLGSISTSEGKIEVEAAVAAITSHQVKQGSANQARLGQMNRQQALARQLVEKNMRPIAKFARGKLRGAPGYAELTVKVSTASPTRLLTCARTMANIAAKYADRFATAGLAADTVDRLVAATDAFADAMDQRAHAKGLRLVSTTEIENALAQGRDAVHVLDALITQQFPANDALLVAWRSISRVEDKPGKTRGVPRSSTPVPGATPPVVPVVPPGGTEPPATAA
jgi:hypothetical protein